MADDSNLDSSNLAEPGADTTLSQNNSAPVVTAKSSAPDIPVGLCTPKNQATVKVEQTTPILKRDPGTPKGSPIRGLTFSPSQVYTFAIYIKMTFGDLCLLCNLLLNILIYNNKFAV